MTIKVGDKVKLMLPFVLEQVGKDAIELEEGTEVEVYDVHKKDNGQIATVVVQWKGKRFWTSPEEVEKIDNDT